MNVTTQPTELYRASSLWEKHNVPAGHKILSAIWAFKRKRRINTQAVYKHKARIDKGGKDCSSLLCGEAYSRLNQRPVVNAMWSGFK
jgi:hypothetical protein